MPELAIEGSEDGGSAGASPLPAKETGDGAGAEVSPGPACEERVLCLQSHSALGFAHSHLAGEG